ncbi:MAG TPA: hypothetical protein VK425_11000, partial [Acidimicrobiales bacterium]|nr:hypothetical protein [Acidimicrobiales bacterium]
SLIETGALIKQTSEWELRTTGAGEVPEVLERLIRSRVDRLPAPARETIVAASVLGGEFSVPALRAVMGVNGELPGILGQLCASGLLREVGNMPGSVYRFRHALIQEATYKGLLRSERRQLHARAAWGLEAASADRMEEVAAVLGHHYASAGEMERAVHHLEVAGDHAAAAFANDEAVSSYRYALALADEDEGPDGPARARVRLRQKLASVHLRTGKHAEARAGLHEAIAIVGDQDSLKAAQLQSALGRVETADHEYQAAVAAFDAADELVGPNPEHQDQASVDIWLEVQLEGRANLHYWRNEPDRAAEVLERAAPVVEARGTAAQRQSFHWSTAGRQLRESRYRVDEGTLAHLRAAEQAGRETGDEQAASWTIFTLGFGLLWHGDFEAAEKLLSEALATADRVGDLVLRARCLCYLNVAALRRHDTKRVRALAPEALLAGETAKYPEYVAAAKATMAWVAWHEGREDDVVALSDEAMQVWAACVVSYSWYSLCLFPLLALHLRHGRVADAAAISRQLLAPPQVRLADEVEALLASGSDLWDAGEAERAAADLTRAVDLAIELHFT